MEGFAKWSNYWDKKEMIETPRGTFNVYSNPCDRNFVLFCVHGIGHSALSFSLLAKELKGQLTVVAPDFKCHGDTPGDESKDLELNSMVEDFIALAEFFIPKDKRAILLGHSVGGSVVTFAASKVPSMSIIAIDTIEGSTIQQLPGMEKLLHKRPQAFESANDAIAYVATSGEMENFDSAKISVSGRMKETADKKLTWKTDILKSKEAWPGWFKGFADAFIHAHSYKILILPTIDRLDTPFTIGHMSGKFQLSVINGTSHCVHEDAPDKVADVIMKMVKRIGASSQW